MVLSVRRASVTASSRKALTPLLTASTPVMAVQPLANARAISQSVSASVAGGRGGSGTTGWGSPAAASARDTPIASSTMKLAMKR